MNEPDKDYGIKWAWWHVYCHQMFKQGHAGEDSCGTCARIADNLMQGYVKKSYAMVSD
jgi:hypothetical protein